MHVTLQKYTVVLFYSTMLHHGKWKPDPACFGFKSSVLTAKTSGRAWSRVPSNWVPYVFGLAIISTITWFESAWKASKNSVKHDLFQTKLTYVSLKRWSEIWYYRIHFLINTNSFLICQIYDNLESTSSKWKTSLYNSLG